MNRLRLHGTHTVVTMEVTDATYNEIKKKLEEAGYHHVFSECMIDMTGIGLVKEDKSWPKDF